MLTLVKDLNKQSIEPRRLWVFPVRPAVPPGVAEPGGREGWQIDAKSSDCRRLRSFKL